MFDKVPVRVRDDLRFIKGWLKKPGDVGSITPTGKVVAGHMAGLIPINDRHPILELGPGTGVITRAILERGIRPERLISIESGLDFYRHLTKTYPNVNFVFSDALEIDTALQDFADIQFSGVVGAIPLLNLPMQQRIDLISDYLNRVADNGPFVQICYGTRPPVEAIPGRFTVEKSARIYRNIPPAAVWVYRKDYRNTT